MQTSYEWISTAPQAHIQRERAKARQLKVTQWWRQRIGPGVCHHCQERFPVANLTMDHLVPLAKGGRTAKSNVVPSCFPCNQERSHRSDRPT